MPVDDFLIDHVSKTMRQTTMPADIVLKIREGATGYTGHALAMRIAGEDVVVLARTIPQLDIVFNKLNAHDPNATMRTSACPKIAVVALKDVTLDEEL